MKYKVSLSAIAAVLTSLALSGCGGNTVDKLDATTRAFVLAAGTWDVNGDGTVSCQDWKDYATRQFKRADKKGRWRAGR